MAGREANKDSTDRSTSASNAVNPFLAEGSRLAPLKAPYANPNNEVAAPFIVIPNPFDSAQVANQSFCSAPSIRPPHAEDANAVQDWKYKGTGDAHLSSQPDGSIRLSSDTAQNTVKNPAQATTLSHPIGQNLSEGEGIDVHLKYRSSQSTPFIVGVMEKAEPYAQTFSEPLQSSSQWQDIVIHGITPQACAGDLTLNIKIKGQPASFDIKDVSIVPSKTFTAGAPHYSLDRDGNVIDNSAPTSSPETKPPNYGIRNGSPFLVGFEVQSLDPKDTSAAQHNIQGLLKDYATGATVTPYWNQWEQSQEPFRDKITWLQQQPQNLEIKIHPALWGENVPFNLPTDWQKAEPEIKAHAMEIAKLPGKFVEINEVADNDSKGANGVTNWIRHEGTANATEEAIDWIRKADPNKTIIYNDYQNGELEMKMLDQLQKDHKLPDAIGIQLHMDQGEWPLQRVEDTINKLAKYGKPIYITEISVLSGEHGRALSLVNHDQVAAMSQTFKQLAQKAGATPDSRTMQLIADRAAVLADPQHAVDDDVTLLTGMDKEAAKLCDPELRKQVTDQIAQAEKWPTSPADEQRQADYTVNLYKLLHDNPHVQGITWWDITDKGAWKLAPRGLFRADGSPKPVVGRLEALFKQWQTKD